MTGGRDGFLLIDKPGGVTSFYVVDRLRRTLLSGEPASDRSRRRGRPRPPRYKCGHTGTLDPDATGLLVVLVGRGSRLAPFLSGMDKTYVGTVRLGNETHTLDASGTVTATAAPPSTPEDLTRILPQFRGRIEQVPPLVSALKRDGKALHARVRAGEDLAEPESRPVVIDSLEITATRWPDPVSGACEADLRVSCGSGTYIRSLARDLARAAGSAGHLCALRRLRIGPFDVADALTDALDMDGAQLRAAVRPLAEALPAVPTVDLDAEQVGAVLQGGQPEPHWLAEPLDEGALIRLLDENGSLVAVARMTAEGPRLAAVLAATAGSTNPNEETKSCG